LPFKKTTGYSIHPTTTRIYKKGFKTPTTRIVYKKGFKNPQLQGLYIKKDLKNPNYKDCI
jgi:hypothetical protein